MPNITIKEQDLTTPGGVNASSNIVYVPGFAKYAKKGTGIYYFYNVSDFKAAFANSNGEFEYLKQIDETDSAKYCIEAEKSQLYALALLSVGLPVMFDCLWAQYTDSDTPNAFPTGYVADGVNKYQKYILDKIADRITEIKNTNKYNIKFITTGGYYNTNSTTTTEQKHSILLGARKDCTSLIDHEEKTSALYIGTGGELSGVPTDDNGKFGAMFTPWCTFSFPTYEQFSDTISETVVGNRSIEFKNVNMPGSLAYLLAYGTSVANGNANWLAAAGASRGSIPYLVKPLVELTEAQIETYSLSKSSPKYSGVAINPIATINPYGTIVWGNRTLNKNASGLVASSFLNIRQLTNDIKKTIYAACKGITFEQNSDLLWIKFKSLVTPLLDQMQTGDGISGYELKKKKSTGKATLTAVVRIYPIEAVEDFDITVELADEATTVEG